MSNLVRVENGIVALKLHEFDIPRFKAVWERVRGMKDAPRWEDDVEGNFVFYYFDQAVFVDSYTVVLGFGEGRCQWSWRSMRASVLGLRGLVKVRKVVAWRVRDESDGYRKAFWMRVDLREGLPAEKDSSSEPGRKWTLVPLGRQV
jgi:hypothetical protein